MEFLYLIYYLVPLILLSVAIYIIKKGQPRSISLNIEGFIDNYEHINFQTRGKIRKDYKPWTGKNAVLIANGAVGFKSYFLNWGKTRTIPVIIEFVDETIENAQEKVGERYAFTIVDHTMEIVGYCRKCASSKEH